MDKIIIDRLRDYVIVEKSDGNNILSGSKLFCGCCGNSLAEVQSEIVFPFESAELEKILKNKTFRKGFGGSIFHAACGHSMFFGNKKWRFITLENYNKQINSE